MSSETKNNLPISKRGGVFANLLKKSLFWGFLVFVIPLCVYLPTVQYDFVWDDLMLIAGNENLCWDNAGKLLVSPFWAIGKGGVPANVIHMASYYRPVIILSYLFENTLFSGKPWGFHLVNSLMHALNAVLLYMFLLYLFSKPWQAFLLSLVYALHPMHTEVVAFIAGRTDIFASVFIMIALNIYIRYPAKRIVSWQVLAMSIFALLGFASKEVAFLLPFALIGLHLLSRKIELPDFSFKNRARYWAGLVVSIIIFLSLRFVALSGIRDIATNPPIRFGEIYTLPILVAKYISLCIAPWTNNPIIHTLNMNPTLLTLEIILLLLIIFSSLKRGTYFATYGFGWFLLFISPAIFVSLVIDRYMAERYLYVPMMGLLIVLGFWLFKREKIGGKKIAVIAVCLLTVSAVFGGFTVRRNQIYNNPFSFWSAVVEQNPENATAQYNLGLVYLNRGEHEKAAHHSAISLELNPYYNVSSSFVNLSSALVYLGLPDSAIVVAQNGLYYSPENYRLYQNLGFAFYRKHDFANAYYNYSEALQIDSSCIGCWNSMIWSLAQMGDEESARRELEKFTKAYPEDANIQALRDFINDKFEGGGISPPLLFE